MPASGPTNIKTSMPWMTGPAALHGRAVERLILLDLGRNDGEGWPTDSTQSSGTYAESREK